MAAILPSTQWVKATAYLHFHRNVRGIHPSLVLALHLDVGNCCVHIERIEHILADRGARAQAAGVKHGGAADGLKDKIR